MKRAIAALGLASTLALVAYNGPVSASGEECRPQGELGNICAEIIADDVVITVQGQEIARIPAPVKTVTVNIPVPGPTQIIPGPVHTVIERIPPPTVTPSPSPVPGPVRTVLVPGPVRTVTVPGPTVTSTLTARPSPATLRPTPIMGPAAIRTRVVEKRIEVSVPEALGMSLALLTAGIALGIMSIFMAYGTGFKDSESMECQRLKALSDEVFINR